MQNGNASSLDEAFLLFRPERQVIAALAILSVHFYGAKNAV